MKEIHKRILEKAIQLCFMADREELVFGNVGVVIGDRSIEILDGSKVRVNYNEQGKMKNIIYGKSPLSPKEGLRT